MEWKQVFMFQIRPAPIVCSNIYFSIHSYVEIVLKAYNQNNFLYVVIRQTHPLVD